MTVPRSRPADSRPPRGGEVKGARLGAPLALAPSPDRARWHDGSGSAGQVPRERFLVRHLATDPSFTGIGYAKAAKLLERFGDNLPRLLADGDPAPFVEILGEKTATVLVEAWREQLARNDIVVWLDENGFSPRLATKIVGLWGAEGARRLREHPYALMALAGWREVDAAARRLGVPQTDPRRLVAAVEAVLYEALHDQNTWMPDDRLRKALEGLLGTRERVAEAVELARACGAAVPLEGGWQPAGAAMMEGYIAMRISAMCQPATIGDLIARPVEREELDAWLDKARRAVGVDLNAEQRAAVHQALRRRFGLVSGGAGVGKTTVLRAVCAAAEAFGRVVHLMALAGRAAVRMTEATGRPASTIAAFLKKCEARKVALGPESLVVVDESSMLDLPTFYRMIRHLPEDAHLLLVGDEGQLGPIGFGLTFHAFVQAPLISRVRLTRVYRQAETSSIPFVAAKLRSGEAPDLPTDLADGHAVTLVGTHAAPGKDVVEDVVAELGGFSEDLRVLAPLKGGPVGVIPLNARFHDLMAPGRPRLAGRNFALGEPVIFGRNDYQRDLRNGSLGEVVEIEDDALVVNFDGVRHRFTAAALDDLAHAYAISIHKAQGSQFRTVVIPFTESRLLDRSLIYTAVTRATERVVLVGQRDVLRRAVARPAAAGLRATGFTRRAADP